LGLKVLFVSSIEIDPILRLQQVLAVFPVSRSAWYKGVKNGTYPQGLKLTKSTIGWRSSDVKKLIDSLCTGPLGDDTL
jgi:predicted DNA-binding transcriptional regulator AlpA